MAGLSRLDLFARLGRVATAETMFSEATAYVEDRNWRERLHRSPHGPPWHTSFHVSEFPAGDPRWCARKALYEMMAFPLSEPASRMLVGTAEMGEAAERWNALNLEYDGRILAAASIRQKKIGIEDADHWLTGAPDMVVLPRYWNRPHVIETKTKDQEVVVDMRALRRTYDPPHARQCRGYVGVGSRVSSMLWPSVVVCRDTWRLALPGVEDVIDAMVCRDHGINADCGCLIEIDLEPIRSGSLIYMGRNRPNLTCEYFFEHDEEWFGKGLRVLDLVREHFEQDLLPPHPFGGKDWSKLPCQYCRHKRNTCRPDHAKGVRGLTDSHGVEFAREVYGSYDPEAVRKAVIDRWSGRSGVSATVAGKPHKGTTV